ncbi:hypothetical protein CL656_03315 [bacterium]|nr:hypothetical protein [bacterium]|tara:strand:+ start:2097 stop:2840 length:744 start_codon:yes stop_codon:yes gene_type:complete
MFKSYDFENKIVISIDGNIGSGKSTFFTILKEKYKNRIDIRFLDEPVDKWSEIKDEQNITMLENYCKDQTKYGFSFQIMACVTRMKILMDALHDPNVKFIISERSILTDKNVFAKMLFDANNISKMDYDIYKIFYDTHKNFIKNIVLVYIQTSPKICKERIQKRNRKGEDLITLDYLEMCHKYHEDWIMNPNVNHKMIIDGNNDHNKNKEQLTNWSNDFDSFLNRYDTQNIELQKKILNPNYINYVL